ncbi:MAG: cell division protein FtsZ [Thermomicrobiales bacterium]|nr:cell division protein FtsZ [Thermomicrobiales bacterium]
MQSHAQGPVRGQRRPTQPGPGDRAGYDPHEAEAPHTPAPAARREAAPAQRRDDAGQPYPSTYAHIKVIGVGGGGGNAINRMIAAGVDGIEFIAVNTDAQALLTSEAPISVRIGDKLTKGLGAGGRPETGERAAEESTDTLAELVRGADMVFIAAGMGGGTGTGASPIIAKLAKSAGALTVGVVTKPFAFEGAKRRRAAEEGIDRLRETVDALITIPNERLLQMVDPKTTITEAFKIADDVLRQGIGGISDLITKPGVINLDFADVKTIMRDAGSALMAIGYGSGEARCIDAAKEAIESPLLEMNIEGATGVLYNITGGSNLTLMETSEAAEIIRAAVDEDAEIIYGTSIDPALGDAVTITLIATGFDGGHAYDQPVIRRQSVREREHEPRPVRQMTTPPQNRASASQPIFPEDEWVAESSIIKFLRER